MVSEHLEVERKYDVDAGWTPPSAADLAAVAGVAAVDEPVEHRLEAGYFDTADLRLFRGRVTLRRRTGGPDAGWHLKLPAGGPARRELHASLGRSVRKPPAVLLAPVAGLLRGAAVEPIATLRTRRVVTALRDADGRVLAEIADDTVTASVPGTGTDQAAVVQTWREVEAELVDGAEPVLVALGERLVAAGAVPTSRVSKLGRAIAFRTGDPGRASGGRRKPRAGDVLLAAVRSEVAELLAADIGVRTDGPDAVHRFRVASRRLRSLLVASRSVLDRTVTDPLRTELSWLRGQLDTARDEEVALAHLRALVAEEPVELVLGPVAARLQQTALKAAETSRGHAVGTLSDPRYLRLLDGLQELLDQPPWSSRARDAARPVLRDALRRSARRLERRLEAAEHADGEDHDEALHDARTAAKRVRDVADMARAELGRPAKDLARATRRVQKVLGERQDTVVTRDQCRRLAVVAHADGESTFAYGRLHALEQFRADRAESAFTAMLPDLRPVAAAAAKKR